MGVDMKFSEYVRIGVNMSLPAYGRYLIHSGKEGKTRADVIGAAMLGKFGPQAHCTSLTDVKEAFPDFPVSLILEIANRNDHPYKGKKMTRLEIADWLEEKGY